MTTSRRRSPPSVNTISRLYTLQKLYIDAEYGPIHWSKVLIGRFTQTYEAAVLEFGLGKTAVRLGEVLDG
jgi:hypothetical protein